MRRDAQEWSTHLPRPLDIEVPRQRGRQRLRVPVTVSANMSRATSNPAHRDHEPGAQLRLRQRPQLRLAQENERINRLEFDAALKFFTDVQKSLDSLELR